MRTRKVTLSVAPTLNYDKVSIQISDEPIEFEDETDFKKQIAALYDILNGLVTEEFRKIQK